MVHPERRERGATYDQDLRDSPYWRLRDAATGTDMPLRLRRRLVGEGAQRDFPVVEQLAIAGATDYVAELIPVGMVSEAFPDSGIWLLVCDRSYRRLWRERSQVDPGRAARGRTCDHDRMLSTLLRPSCSPPISAPTQVVAFMPVWSNVVRWKVSVPCYEPSLR